MQAAASRPEDQRHRRVQQAVRALLAEQGFGISMDAVAARAGCSKQTLYARYGSKQALFRMIVQEQLALTTVALDTSGADLRGTLLAFAIDHAEHLSEPDTLAACRMMSAEAHRFPGDARTMFVEGLETLHQRLADCLASAMQRGLIAHDDPHMAAELLLGMLEGLDFERKCFNAPHRHDADQRRAWAEFAVDAFLRAFRTAPCHSPLPLPDNA